MSTGLRKLQVSFAGREVGVLAETPAREIYFEYDAEWQARGFALSPYHLPLAPGLHRERTGIFGGLFGVFDDSLPDGWGLLLMDRFFQSKGRRPEELSPMDRLAYIGHGGMGALDYRPLLEEAVAHQAWVNLSDIASQAERIAAGSPEDVLPALLAAGGSSGGSRPKAFVSYHPKSGRISTDVLQPGKGFEHWLVKFRAKEDPRDAGCIEAAYADMARHAGVVMPTTRIFPTPMGNFFGIQRFDRQAGGHRFHIHTFGGMIHASFREFNRDYREFLGTVLYLTRDFRQVEQAFCRAAFNVLAHNRDDHVKNHAFVADKAGQWTLAPAYDLTKSVGIRGQHNMTVMGNGNPGLDDLRKLAEDAGFEKTKATQIMDEVRAAVSDWPAFAKAHGVGNASRKAVSEALKRVAAIP